MRIDCFLSLPIQELGVQIKLVGSKQLHALCSVAFCHERLRVLEVYKNELKTGRELTVR